MFEDKSIIAMIPARMGSQRLARKNTALIGGKPMVAWAIEAAKACPYFDKIVVSTNDPVVVDIAGLYGVDVYNRQEKNASSEARSDEVVYEFIQQYPCDVVAWVNTTSPLQPIGELKEAMEFFFKNKFDSFFTTYEEKTHCFFQHRPVNYNPTELFAKTQDLQPVERFVYSLMMWKTKTFVSSYESTGSAFFCGQTGTYPVSKLSSLLIKNQDDLFIADAIATMKQEAGNYELKYFKK